MLATSEFASRAEASDSDRAPYMTLSSANAVTVACIRNTCEQLLHSIDQASHSDPFSTVFYSSLSLTSLSVAIKRRSFSSAVAWPLPRHLTRPSLSKRKTYLQIHHDVIIRADTYQVCMTNISTAQASRTHHHTREHIQELHMKAAHAYPVNRLVSCRAAMNGEVELN